MDKDKKLTVIEQINDDLFVVKEVLDRGFYYRVNGERVRSARIINGKQYVSIGDEHLLLKKGEHVDVFNWLN